MSTSMGTRRSAIPLSPELVADLGDLAQAMAAELAELAADMRADGVVLAALKSSDVDPVTEADRAVELRARELLAQHRPDDGLLGEEGGQSVEGTSGLTWVIDPIDGTVNYMYGLPCCVSLAVVWGTPEPETWTVVAGAIHRIDADIAVAATMDSAAIRTRPVVESISVRSEATLGHTLVGTGFGYRSGLRAQQGRIIAELLPQVRDIRRVGSAANDLASVAMGALDVYYELALKPWDFAAGSLIVERAGGEVLGIADFHESRLIVAGNPTIAREVRNALITAGVADVEFEPADLD